MRALIHLMILPLSTCQARCWFSPNDMRSESLHTHLALPRSGGAPDPYSAGLYWQCNPSLQGPVGLGTGMTQVHCEGAPLFSSLREVWSLVCNTTPLAGATWQFSFWNQSSERGQCSYGPLVLPQGTAI